jgi:hypothetical protein
VRLFAGCWLPLLLPLLLLLLLLLLLHTQAARVRCTVGEISGALERAWGRHTAATGVAAGYYVSEREAAAAGERVCAAAVGDGGCEGGGHGQRLAVPWCLHHGVASNALIVHACAPVATAHMRVHTCDTCVCRGGPGGCRR